MAHVTRPPCHKQPAGGETAVRLHLVAAWRESTVFTGAERAALVALVALINAANRLTVIVHQRGGSYEPGTFAAVGN